MTLTVVAVVTPVPSAVMLVACVPVGRVRGVSAAVLVLVACVPTTLIVVGVLAVLAAARLVVTAAAT